MEITDIYDLLKCSLEDTAKALEKSVESCSKNLYELASSITASLSDGGKVLLFGNGGSAADAQHIAAEFVNRFRLNRQPLAALALTTDTSVLTSIANDFDYRHVFAKQVQALARRGDVVIGISTSGNSPNVVMGLEAARAKKAITVGFTGRNPGTMAPLCDILISAASADTPRIQEVHIFLAHCLCDLVEKELFKSR
jgi:D-sedoheptulose 7-phosphate isomerase